MWRKKTGLVLLAILPSILLATSCATLTRKRTQRIPVTSSPAGATVSVNGQHKGLAPLEIRLARKERNVIRIESPGYNPLEIRMKREYSGVHAMGNVLVGCAAGILIAVKIHYDHFDEGANLKKLMLISSLPAIGSLFLLDLASSAGYTLSPKDLMVTLNKADGTPRVDTLLIDANDLQNIKWIRVRRD